jgi:hypothetical protein
VGALVDDSKEDRFLRISVSISSIVLVSRLSVFSFIVSFGLNDASKRSRADPFFVGTLELEFDPPLLAGIGGLDRAGAVFDNVFCRVRVLG